MTDITELKGNMRVDGKFEDKIIKSLKIEYADLEALAGTSPEDIIDNLLTHGIDEERATDALGLRILDAAREIIAIAKVDAEAEKKGLISKRKRAKVPFKERFRLGLLGGTKTCTTRPYKIGNPGDEFEAFGAVFEITNYEELMLGDIAKHHHKEGGFGSEEEFIKFWPTIHPRKKFNPNQIMPHHTFKLISITPPKGSEAIPPEPSKKEGKTPGQTTKKGDSASTSLINQAQKTLDMDWSKMQKNYVTRTCFVPLSEIHENDFNPNVMTEEDEYALQKSMSEQGPEHTPPIIVMESKAYPGYVIIDGAHRYRMARVLSWDKMLVTIRHDVDELAAMSLCWKMNARRGHLDWFREAKMFSTMSKKGKSHEEIADLLTVKVPYVRERISILVLGEENVLQAQKQGISLSALVQVASIKDPVARQKALDKLLSGEVKTTEEVKEITTKKRTCPICVCGVSAENHLPPKDAKKAGECVFEECGVYAGSEKYVKCGSGHYFPVKKPKAVAKSDPKLYDEAVKLQEEKAKKDG